MSQRVNGFRSITLPRHAGCSLQGGADSSEALDDAKLRDRQRQVQGLRIDLIQMPRLVLQH